MTRELIDLTGRRFGRLTVIKRSYPNSKYGRARWLCKCTCGNEIIIIGHNLKNGNTKSCGCLAIELAGNQRRLGFGVASMGYIYNKYKYNAKKRGYEWNLTKEQFKELTQQDCYYCGVKPKNKSKNTNCFGDFIYNGIDRIDNAKGYTIDNVVPCCKLCNQAKMDLTLQEFKDWIKRAYNKTFKEEEDELK